MSDQREDNQADDLLEDFRQQPRSLQEAKKDFFPWHKPRKQYVRKYQWCAALDDIITSGALKTMGRPLSYLGLPGDDMLDIRILHSVVAKHSLKLRYLGFNLVREVRSTEYSLSHHELRSQEYACIDGAASGLLNDPLEDLNDEHSVSRRALQDYAPFDIVNFDLCGSIGTNPRVNSPTIGALRAILEEQRASKPDPWLLFVTTRANKKKVHAAVWELLVPILEQNIRSNAPFRNIFTQCVGLPDDIVAAQRGVHSLQEGAFCQGFITGFCKWLIKIGLSGSPSLKVSLINTHAYSVMNGLDMFSLAFRFDKVVVPGKDSTGWTQDRPSTSASIVSAHQLDEKSLAYSAIQGIANTIDVDKLLRERPDLLNEMVDESAALLKQARYDDDLYRQWVANGCLGMNREI